jgi:hypothetical protein
MTFESGYIHKATTTLLDDSPQCVYTLHQSYKMEETLVNLRILSKLQPFQRLNTRRRLFEITPRRFLPEWLQRWWDGSTRESDFGRIRDVYMAAFDNMNEGMRAHLKESTKGLQSLKKTYENDQTMLARLDNLIESVEAVCNETF